jgi:hypothetical protein
MNSIVNIINNYLISEKIDSDKKIELLSMFFPEECEIRSRWMDGIVVDLSNCPRIFENKIIIRIDIFIKNSYTSPITEEEKEEPKTYKGHINIQCVSNQNHTYTCSLKQLLVKILRINPAKAKIMLEIAAFKIKI